MKFMAIKGPDNEMLSHNDLTSIVGRSYFEKERLNLNPSCEDQSIADCYM